MGITVIRPGSGRQSVKQDRARFLADADDNATAVVTIVNPSVGKIQILEIIAGYNADPTTDPVNLTVVRNSVTLADIAMAQAAGTVVNRALLPDAAAEMDSGFDVVITLAASGGAGQDGFLFVKYRYDNSD